jgi:Fe-S cluster biogenesis protein NfuA
MEYKLMIQSTPNPNALKFVLNTPVKDEGNFTYKSAGECEHNPLAGKLFAISPDIKEVYFFDNYITVTQNGNGDWDTLETAIKKTILENIASHDPKFSTPKAASESKASAKRTPEMEQIDAILDQTVRPALQMDGGDIQLMDYEANKLKVFYQGACGSCPSSAMGTLQAIENILKNEFNPDITVELAEQM